MKYRYKVNKSASKAIFRRNAARVDVRNLRAVPTRGGIRL